MGLFSSKTKTYVSSAVYSLAGEYTERTDYLKYLAINAILSNTDRSVGENIVSGTLNGPRLNYQSFFKWAVNNYTEGLPSGGAFGNTNLDGELVAPHVPVTPGREAVIDIVKTGFADFTVWAEQYMLENRRDEFLSDWESTIDEATKLITITLEDETPVTFLPVDYDFNKKYVYVFYTEFVEATNDNEVLKNVGPVLGPYTNPNQLPSLDNTTLVDEYDTFDVPKTLNKRTVTTKTYSDSTPPEYTEDTEYLTTEFYDKFTQVFKKHIGNRIEPSPDDRGYNQYDYIHIWQEPEIVNVLDSTTTNTVEISPGVFETTTIKVFKDVVLPNNVWMGRVDLYERELGISTPSKIWIYQIGSGKFALDALANSTPKGDGFFPMIPVRTNNSQIDEAPLKDQIYDQANLAWKRATGNKSIDPLLEQVADNPDINDIDYAFVLFGVPLNTKSEKSKRYVYEFFKTLMDTQAYSSGSVGQYQNQVLQYQNYLNNYSSWLVNRVGAQPQLPNTLNSLFRSNFSLEIGCDHAQTRHYKFKINWKTVIETFHNGLGKPDAKAGDVWTQTRDDFSTPFGFINNLFSQLENKQEINDVFVIIHQITSDSYRMLTVIGAVHQNLVYNGKMVTISSKEALNDSEDSGFVLPLHLSTMKRMSVTSANQMCLENMIIIFNAYTVVKKKWYQSFLGMLVISLVTFGIGAAFVGGAALLSGGGLLGANLAIGTAIGLSGMAAALAGAIVNAIALTVVLSIIQEVASDLGPLGAIIAAVAAIYVGGMVSGGLSSGVGGLDFNFFLRADNLLRLTNGVLNAYGVYIQGKTSDIYTEMADLENDYQKRSKEIQDMLLELTGFSSGFDPMILTNVVGHSFENRDTFNRRTLMTGSDIAKLTHEMISRFPEITLDLESIRGT